MTAFVVISTNSRLHTLVDGIQDSRPLNPAVATLISSGKLLQQEDGLYYEYQSTVKSKPQKIAEELEDLLLNQLAHTKHDAQWGDNVNPLRVFLLENPLDEQENEIEDWIYNSLCKIIRDKKDQNLLITRMCFTFDVSHPENVANAVPVQFIQAKKESVQKQGHNLLLLDNHDKNQAAICNSKESFELMTSRMLADLMMLLSSSNTTYNVANAIQSETNVFSLGYAECFYYYKDVKRYYEIANYRDIQDYMFNTNDIHEDKDELDIEKVPLGLKERLNRMNPIYEPVPFYDDIEKHPQSIDKRIDDILREYFQEKYKALRASLIQEAKQADDEEFEKQKADALANGEVTPIKPIPGNNEKIVRATYPEYCDRRMYYLSMDNDKTEEYHLKCKERYESLLSTLRSKFNVFAQFIETCNNESITNSNNDSSNNVGCIFKFFHRPVNKPIESAPIILNVQDYQKLLMEIKELQDNRKRYFTFKQNVQEVENNVRKYTEMINSFCLTKHCKSIDFMIDLPRLKAHQAAEQSQRINSTIDNWNNLNHQTKTTLERISRENTEKEVRQYQFIDWEYLFPFIDEKTPNRKLEKLTNKLLNESFAFLNYHDEERPTVANLTSTNVISDNLVYTQPIKEQKLNLRDKDKVLSFYSTHTESKICIFQILQVDDLIWKGIVDATDYEQLDK